MIIHFNRSKREEQSNKHIIDKLTLNSVLLCYLVAHFPQVFLCVGVQTQNLDN